MSIRYSIGISVAILVGFSCSQETSVREETRAADVVLTNARIYTADEQQSFAESIAISEDRIAYVGDGDGVKSHVGEDTEVVDLGGRLVLPGLHDVHIHTLGIVELDQCDLKNEPVTLAELSAFVADCLDRYEVPEGEWLSVDLWNFAVGNQPDENFATIRDALDAASTVHPIFLRGSDGHHFGANSNALARAVDTEGNVVGLSKQTLTTHFAEYRSLVGVDKSGEPDGYLTETAGALVQPPSLWGFDGEAIEAAAPQVPAILAASGITTIQDASAELPILDVFDRLEADGLMTFRLSLALYASPEDFVDVATGAFDGQRMLETMNGYRDKYRSSALISADTVKLFVDGVLEGNPYSVPPTLPNAAMLGPYRQPIFAVDEAGESVNVVGYVDLDSDTCASVRGDWSVFDDPATVSEFLGTYGYHPRQCEISDGVLEHPQDMIEAFVSTFYEAGYHLHIHAIGDRATQVGLHAVANAQIAYPDVDTAHTFAHLQLVHDDDIRLMGELGLHAAFTYAWINPEPAYDMTIAPFIDDISETSDIYDRQAYYYRNSYPVRSMRDAGVVLVAGSDAPVDTRDPRPFYNIQQAVTRSDGKELTLNEDERIDIISAIDAYTINGAKSVGHADLTGSIEVGKKADVIVLDRDIISMAQEGAAGEIAEAKVDLTFFDGRLIYDRAQGEN